MKILKAFKTELNPNATQLTLLKKAAGAARWAYNWGLAKKKAAMEKKERIPTAIDLHKELNQLKKTEYESSGKSSNTIKQHRQLSAIKQGESYAKGK